MSAALAVIPTSNSHDCHVVSYGSKKGIDGHASLSCCVKMRENVYFLLYTLAQLNPRYLNI